MVNVAKIGKNILKNRISKKKINQHAFHIQMPPTHRTSLRPRTRSTHAPPHINVVVKVAVAAPNHPHPPLGFPSKTPYCAPAWLPGAQFNKSYPNSHVVAPPVHWNTHVLGFVVHSGPTISKACPFMLG